MKSNEFSIKHKFKKGLQNKGRVTRRDNNINVDRNQGHRKQK